MDITLENILALLTFKWEKMPEGQRAYLSGYAQGVADSKNEQKSA